MLSSKDGSASCVSLRPAVYFILLTLMLPQSKILEPSFFIVDLILSASIPNLFSHDFYYYVEEVLVV
jgi:hypothetical protein